jgi:hypothetical protein
MAAMRDVPDAAGRKWRLALRHVLRPGKERDADHAFHVRERAFVLLPLYNDPQKGVSFRSAV